MKNAYDYELKPEDFPGWNGSPMPIARAGEDRLGEVRPYWRTISFHCGDHFAGWVLEVCRKRPDPWCLIRAICAVLEVDAQFGDVPRKRAGVLLLPDTFNWPDGLPPYPPSDGHVPF